MSTRRHFLHRLLPAALLPAVLLTLLPTVPLRADEAITSYLPPDELQGFATWPAPLRGLISYSLSLTQKKLGYQFGSSDPDLGGMDCSGTIHHVLTHAGLKNVPRQSDALHDWVQTSGRLYPISGSPALTDPILAQLKPGDLLFWTGTYDTGKRTNPISHVMMYLGKNKAGNPLMFGASNGRPYQGKRQNGVSVFDFRIPKPEGKPRFVGYGPPPGLDPTQTPPVPPAASNTPPKPTPTPKSPSKPKKTNKAKTPEPKKKKGARASGP
ncbi:MAG: spr [Verrucomicrobiales bacterium]|nr:spr [Verrucomicrobiales bacterium]